VAVPVDRDDDGMPDVWETEFGLNPDDPDDARADPDRDGASNLDEYRAGTSSGGSQRHSAAYRHRWRQRRPRRIAVPGRAGRAYVVEGSVAPGEQPWSPSRKSPPRSEAVISTSNSSSNRNRAPLFRVRVQ
jgi:hypothetical protein